MGQRGQPLTGVELRLLQGLGGLPWHLEFVKARLEQAPSSLACLQSLACVDWRPPGSSTYTGHAVIPQGLFVVARGEDPHCSLFQWIPHSMWCFVLHVSTGTGEPEQFIPGE